MSRNCNDDMAVTKWNCSVCKKSAVKIQNRWTIVHKLTCTVQTTPEDVGPVTSVNDPDNAYFVIVDDD